MLTIQRKARLSWHCRRGMLELDLILQHFLQQGIEKLSEQEIQAFEILLNYTDPELFSWFMGHEIPPDQELFKIVTIIRNNYQT